jgi:XTP/dITP diphosphohydrolase
VKKTERLLLLATANRHKVSELTAILGDVPFRLLTLSDFPPVAPPPEDGQTYEENSGLKAAWYGERTGVLALADDSGLEIDCLGGEPGIRSARYFGEDVPFVEKNRRILDMMRDVPLEKRGARFVCVATLAFPGGRKLSARGTCTGVIARTPAGSHGFGYDPIFFIPRMKRTMAELPEETKNRISHRARALARVRAYLTTSDREHEDGDK